MHFFRLLGGTLLIGGSCIGAGMLGLPIMMGLSGFFPSLLMLFTAWAFMTATALLVLEVNSNFSKDVNLITMVGHSLGKWGQWLSWILYIFLFYSLLVAYQADIGMNTSSLIHQWIRFTPPPWLATAFFLLAFGFILSLGIHKVDLFNRFLMMGKIVSYLGIVALGFSYVIPSQLFYVDMHYLFRSLPILVISFGFHNMIPTITSYMKGDYRSVRLAIWLGSTLALIVYLVWSIIVLGIVPMNGAWGITESFQAGKDASLTLSLLLGTSWVTSFAQGLAYFSLLTSLLLQSLAFVHFLADGLKVKRTKLLIPIVLVAPYLLSIIDPQIFFRAIDFAGGICATLLFGVLPVFMAWIGRYHKKSPSSYRLSGGKPLLMTVFGFAVFVFVLQFIQVCF